MIIRKIEQGDLPALAAMEDHFTQKNLIKLMAAPAFVGLVAIEEQTMIAFIIGWSTGGAGEIIQITVKADYQKQGIGLRLLNRFCQDYAMAGCSLEVRADNFAALKLYAKAGFLETARRKNYYKSTSGAPSGALSSALSDDGRLDRIDAVVMQIPPKNSSKSESKL